MPIYEALPSWWVGAAVMASFVIFTPEGRQFCFILFCFILFYFFSLFYSFII